jgi:hypothetical protein
LGGPVFVWLGKPGGGTIPAPAPVIDDPASFALGNGRPVVADWLPVASPVDHPWSLDIELGLPSGLRAQRSLGDNVGHDWLVEGFVGFEIIFPMAGGGLRRRFTLVCGERDTFQISPGVDGYVLYNTLHDISWFSNTPRTIGLVTGDVDILWQHAMSDRWSGTLGVKLGAGSAGHGVLPVGSIVFGFQF